MVGILLCGKPTKELISVCSVFASRGVVWIAAGLRHLLLVELSRVCDNADFLDHSIWALYEVFISSMHPSSCLVLAGFTEPVWNVALGVDHSKGPPL